MLISTGTSSAKPLKAMPLFKRFRILVIPAFCLMIACSDTPRGVLTINEMKVILLDKLMAEEFYNNFLYRDTVINKDSARSALYAQVFKIHAIDSTTFYKSFAFYKNDPLRFKELIDSANAYANRERERRYAQPVTDTATTTK